ncbi:RecX family transcriptional regulator [candidate division KSB1 bacterium]|nr:RecX family transcriptional regulator [candidate division KSB1 bacterium]
MVDRSGKITKIEAQKQRASVYLDGEFAFGLDSSVLLQFDLKKGDILTKTRIKDILQKEEKKRVKENAFRYLAARAHSEKELQTKLRQKGYAEELIETVLWELREAKFIDDVKFAFAFARNRIAKKPMGARLLRQELWQKGLKPEIIDKALTEAYSAKRQEEIARELVESRKDRYQDLDENKQKKRLNDFLLRRGFDWEIVKEVIAEK